MKLTAKRLKEAIDDAGIKQSELCDRTGISKGALSSYLSGRYEPKQNNIYTLATVLNVNPAWLMGLSVPKSPDVPVVRELTKEQRELLACFDILNGSGKAEAIKRIRELTELEKYKSIEGTVEELRHILDELKASALNEDGTKNG